MQHVSSFEACPTTVFLASFLYADTRIYEMQCGVQYGVLRHPRDSLRRPQGQLCWRRPYSPVALQGEINSLRNTETATWETQQHVDSLTRANEAST